MRNFLLLIFLSFFSFSSASDVCPVTYNGLDLTYQTDTIYSSSDPVVTFNSYWYQDPYCSDYVAPLVGSESTVPYLASSGLDYLTYRFTTTTIYDENIYNSDGSCSIKLLKKVDYYGTTCYYNQCPVGTTLDNNGSCVCDDPSKQFDTNTGQCTFSCPVNASPDPNNPESCKCNDGYEPSYSLDGTFECLEKQCLPIVDDLPFFLKVSPADISLCNFFPLSDSSFVELDPSTGCCYGQPNFEDNSTCPSNNIEINGQCYPVTSSDDNDTPVSHVCPTGEYWSFSANGGQGGCVPFFTDSNGTDPLPSDGLDGTITGSDGNLSAIDLGYNFDNLGQDQGFADGLVKDVVNLDGVSTELNKLLDSYVLIDLPLRATGSCDAELTKTITVLGASYTIDARPWVSKFNEYLPLIRSFVIFSFVFSGVLIVLGRGGD